MYMPFLRGRQFDLEALENLIFRAKNYSDNKVIPIIEPVDFKKAQLKSYYKLVTSQTPFVLIINPTAGGILQPDVEKNLVNGTLAGYEGYFLAYTISQLTTLQQVRSFVDRFPDHKISFIHHSLSGQNDQIVAYLNGLAVVHHHIFISNALSKRYIESIKSPGAKKIDVIDRFNKQPNNAAYAGNTHEQFSDSHKTFKSSGFDGFGDFSIMGEKFENGGGRPRAVVIHWPYLNPDGNVWIKHFVSDNMEGTEDIAGKFGEAYKKLSAFRKQDPSHIESLGSYYISNKGDNGELPQLGAIKQYSIMHHIELIRNLLD